MTYAILVINIKGGTGKSTVAQELAYAMRDEGYDIGVMDADIDSANLASRMGSTEMVDFEGDHIITPVQHEGMKLYSMENAFQDSSFSQTGRFMADVVKDMIESSAWGDLDYLIVDCPPGSSDIFVELIRALRANILGAISVGISDAVDDTARLVQVANHNWLPILGFIENMSGIYCHGNELKCDPNPGEFSIEKHKVKPFGKGDIKAFAESLGGDYLGDIPMALEDTEIRDVADDTIQNTIDAIENADEAPLPDNNLGDKSFIKNVWNMVTKGIKRVNDDIPVKRIQEQFGVEGREPLVMEIELTDAGPISDKIFSSIVLTVDDGNLKPIKKSTAQRRGLDIEGGMSITSQNLYYALSGEKKVMRSVTGEVITEPYSIIDAVKMGDAEVWGDKTINRLAVLDKVLTDVVEVGEIQKAMKQA